MFSAQSGVSARFYMSAATCMWAAAWTGLTTTVCRRHGRRYVRCGRSRGYYGSVGAELGAL
ncbi:phosphoric ester hydrolase [Histoplasma ohiense]|nr:phosphoric ester hydrolase [Histoplasma ohiense (nom. inval.)]